MYTVCELVSRLTTSTVLWKCWDTRIYHNNTPHERVVRPKDGALNRRALRKLGVLFHVGNHRGLGGLDRARIAALPLSQHLYMYRIVP